MAEKTLPFTDHSLIGQHLYLRPVNGTDLESIYVWAQQVNAHKTNPFPQPYSSSAEFVDTHKKSKPANEGMLAIIRRKDDMLVGQISFSNYNPLNRSAEVNILIDPDVHRKKIGTEAMTILAKHLFRQRGLNKIYLLVNSGNKALNGFLDEFGFKKNGVLKDHFYIDGQFQEGHLYELAAFELGP